MENDEPVLVAEFVSSPEAQAACGLLRSAGIPSFLKGERPGIVQPNWAHVGDDGLLLMVPASFLAQARELLDSRVSERDIIAAAEGGGNGASVPDEAWAAREASILKNSSVPGAVPLITERNPKYEERERRLKFFLLIGCLVLPGCIWAADAAGIPAWEMLVIFGVIVGLAWKRIHRKKQNGQRTDI
jgi:hypothetical protein